MSLIYWIKSFFNYLFASTSLFLTTKRLTFVNKHLFTNFNMSFIWSWVEFSQTNSALFQLSSWCVINDLILFFIKKIQFNIFRRFLKHSILRLWFILKINFLECNFSVFLFTLLIGCTCYFLLSSKYLLQWILRLLSFYLFGYYLSLRFFFFFYFFLILY